MTLERQSLTRPGAESGFVIFMRAFAKIVWTDTYKRLKEAGREEMFGKFERDVPTWRKMTRGLFFELAQQYVNRIRGTDTFDSWLQEVSNVTEVSKDDILEALKVFDTVALIDNVFNVWPSIIADDIGTALDDDSLKAVVMNVVVHTGKGKVRLYQGFATTVGSPEPLTGGALGNRVVDMATGISEALALESEELSTYSDIPVVAYPEYKATLNEGISNLKQSIISKLGVIPPQIATQLNNLIDLCNFLPSTIYPAGSGLIPPGETKPR